MPDSLRTIVNRWGPARAAVLGVTGLGIVVLLLLVSRWAAAPAWVPVVQGQPLERVAQITAKLDENTIEYRLEQGGAVVQVREADLARSRVLLAQAGLPSAADPGFELFDRPSWGMTDFTQRINYRRALEGELERSIGEMKGVAGATVHLALSDRSSSRRKSTQEAASVVLRLEPGARTGAELVEAISSLVASSVDGLASERITVLDDTGRLLSAAVEEGQVSGARKRELALRRDMEGYLEQRAEDLVAEVFGPGNVRVRVAAELSFDRTDRTVQKVDPDQQFTTSEERTEVMPAPGQTAGTSASTATYEASRSMEVTSSTGGEIRRMTVAVLLNATAGSEESNPAAVEQLVANAVGLNRGRGDSISVMSVAFSLPAPIADSPEGGMDIIGWIDVLRRPVLGVLGLLLAFVLGMNVLRVVRGALRPVGSATASAAALEPAHAMAALPRMDPPEGRLAQQAMPVVQSQLNPELAARVIRAWARDS